jgi:crotonobetainyl-CoA:carnitine CoA-transferase CaiB-like acyl-CoA transferase
MIPQVAAVFSGRTRDHWMAACAEASVPDGKVKSIPEVFDSPNVRERGLVQTLPHPHLGSVAMVRPAQGLAAQLTADFTAPPMLGQDTQSVLADVLGYSAETIDQLIGTGAVGVYTPAAEPIPA